MARGLLGRLFGRRAAAVEAPPTLEALLGLCLGPTAAPLIRLDAAGLNAALAQRESGVGTLFLCATDRPRLSVLYPDAVQRSPGVERRLARIAALEPPPPGADANLSVRSSGTHRVPFRFGPADRAAQSWRAHDCLGWTAGAGVTSPLVLMPEERARTIEDLLAGTRSAAAQGLIEGADTEPETAPSNRLVLESPRELVAAGLFLPACVACGSHIANARFHAVAVGSAVPQPLTGVWITAGCTLTGKPWQYAIRFRVDSPERSAALAGTLRQLVACELREVLKSLTGLPGAGPTRPVVAAGHEPEPPRLGAYLVLEGRVAVSGLSLPCEVWVPGPSLAALCELALDAGDWAQVRMARPALLAALVALNQHLLPGLVGRLDREMFEPRGLRTTVPRAFPLAAFLELAPDRDARLTLQNHVLTMVGARNLRPLFAYAEVTKTADGREVRRTIWPVAMNVARLEAFLPRPAVQEWRASAALPLPDRAAYLRRNAEVLAALRFSARKRQLLLSQRAHAILDTLYYPTVSAQTRKHLEEAARNRLPFSEIEKLSRPRIQELLGRVPARQLCLALVDADAEMKLVRANTSRTKSEELTAELKGLKRRLEDGSVDLEEVLQAKEAIAAEARRTREADEERERRGGAARGTPPPGRGKQRPA